LDRGGFRSAQLPCGRRAPGRSSASPSTPEKAPSNFEHRRIGSLPRLFDRTRLAVSRLAYPHGDPHISKARPLPARIGSKQRSQLVNRPPNRRMSEVASPSAAPANAGEMRPHRAARAARPARPGSIDECARDRGVARARATSSANSVTTPSFTLPCRCRVAPDEPWPEPVADAEHVRGKTSTWPSVAPPRAELPITWISTYAPSASSLTARWGWPRRRVRSSLLPAGRTVLGRRCVARRSRVRPWPSSRRAAGRGRAVSPDVPITGDARAPQRSSPCAPAQPTPRPPPF